MYIFDFEKEEMDNTNLSIEETTKEAIKLESILSPKVPADWNRESVERHNPGLCDELLNCMW